MNTRPLFFILSLLAIIVAASAYKGKHGAILGGYKTIENLHDPHVQEIAKYAISEHNHKAVANLKFGKVIKGESQVVSGTNYRLVIAAKDGSSVHNYQAVVYEKPWAHYRNLTSFNLV